MKMIRVEQMILRMTAMMMMNLMTVTKKMEKKVTKRMMMNQVMMMTEKMKVKVVLTPILKYLLVQ